jgi:hypothetical protein
MVAGFFAVSSPAAADPSGPESFDCPDQVLDEAAAVGVAAQCGKRVEITDATSETSQAWALPSGEISRLISAAPVRVKRDSEWVPLDLTLEFQPDGSVAAKADPTGVVMSGATTENGVHELATIGQGDERVVMGWTGPLPTPSLDGNKATYPEVKPGIDLVVEATVKGVESFYIVKNRAAAANVNDITVPITGVDVASHKLTTDGRLTLLDDERQTAAYSPTPLMWDARTDPATGEPTQVRVMDSSATARPATDTSEEATPIEGAGVNLKITPDSGFLADSRTVYPVTIDPQLIFEDPTWDTWVNEGDTFDHSLDYYAQIGAYNGKIGRAFVNFNVADLKAKEILSATVGLYNYHSNSCVGIDWEIWSVTGSSTSTRWTSQPTWKTKEATASGTKGGPSGCTAAGMIYIDGKQFFQRQADEQRNIGYMGIRATREDLVASRKNFYSQNYSDTSKSPYAIVNYKLRPTVSSRGMNQTDDGSRMTSACIVGDTRPVVNTTTPRMWAQFAHATDTTVAADFEYADLAGNVIGGESVDGVPIQGAAEAWVPQNKLVSGESYKWHVRSRVDGTSNAGPFSGWCEFTVRATFSTRATAGQGPVDNYVPPTFPDLTPEETPEEPLTDNVAPPNFYDGLEDAPEPVDPSILEEDPAEEPAASAQGVVDTSGHIAMPVVTTQAPVQCPPNVDPSTFQQSCVVSQNEPAAGQILPEEDDNETASASAVKLPIGKLGSTPLDAGCMHIPAGRWAVNRYAACYREVYIQQFVSIGVPSGQTTYDGAIQMSVYRLARMSPVLGTWDYHMYMHVDTVLPAPGGRGLSGARVEVTGSSCVNQLGVTVDDCTTETNGSSQALKLGTWASFDAIFDFRVPMSKRITRYGVINWEVSRPGLDFDVSRIIDGEDRSTSPWVRCDRDLLGSTSTGCVIPNFLPVMKFDKKIAPELANHLIAAQRSGLPGRADVAQLEDRQNPIWLNRLTRAASDWARTKNGDRACPSGQWSRVGAPSPATHQCDEYPFRSTYQGAYTSDPLLNSPRWFKFCNIKKPKVEHYVEGTYGYSKCYIKEKQNQYGGNQIKNFYSAVADKGGHRILDDDGFYVKVV